MSMKMASLFSGIGGFEIAAENVGWEIMFHCEIDPFCNVVLDYYWPKTKKYYDIKKSDFTIWRGRIDVLCGGSHASHTHTPGNDLEKTTSAICGLKCLEQFEKFSRPGLWARTFAALLIGMGGWYSTRCKLTWRLRGTKSNRLYFQLQGSTRHTSGNGCFLLPTVMASDGTTGAIISEHDTYIQTSGLPRKINRNGVNGSVRLGRLVQMLPTVTAMDATGATAKMKSTQTKEGTMHSVSLSQFIMLPTVKTSDFTVPGRHGNGGQDLRTVISEAFLPTPTCNDKNNNPETPSQAKRDNIAGSLRRQGLTHSQLNPRFVAEMMGYPVNWTELPFQSGAKKV